ncbi:MULTISPECIES: glycosyltransferase family 2 protein [Halomonas]|uniref:glycosyltransferase family 2 protein n=1 Tax=Halomonas TaxID=2745 RepID=UPI001C96213E|nr:MULTISPECIES: glycosyltransferase family 2 protein [Halomonas]MBY6206125.1 glycosyltransferase family 2 protein [Halomonas sp. DP3Y7-2]MBY6227984.1 glycosyltransferase family 2 protein [Halomonas sp. DP3Y7-1]MCA0916051.1 glycosyltransferase family 2 protein [Halomonas denitrificans]
MEKFCLAGIVKNEVDYMLEWVAWHHLAGFDHVIVADNMSTDGTRSLLEAMELAGLIKLIYQPTLARNTQAHCYNRVLESALGKFEFVMFLDADEFLVHESQRHGEERRLLDELTSCGGVGSISINWRCFGSGGLINKSAEPVLRRFTHCSDSSDFSADRHVKSMIRVDHVKRTGIHASLLICDMRHIDCQGEDIRDFSCWPDDKGKPDPRSGMTDSIRKGPLRVHHYAVKTEEEYQQKRLRGSAVKGNTFDRGDDYFRYHDVRGAEFAFQPGKLSRLEREMAGLDQRLASETPLGRPLRGIVSVSNATTVMGWITDLQGDAGGLFVNIFVNGVHVGRVSADMYRPDLLHSGRSVNGYCGFRWTHPLPLKLGDRVTVTPHANASNLGGQSNIVVGKE